MRQLRMGWKRSARPTKQRNALFVSTESEQSYGLLRGGAERALLGYAECVQKLLRVFFALFVASW